MSRHTVRDALVALAWGASFNQVLGYGPEDLAGATKVLAIYNLGTKNTTETAGFNRAFHRFALEVYILRAGAPTEDDLDACADAIRSVCQTAANVSNANWEDLSLDTDSEAGFAEVSGQAYRIERFTATVKEII